MPKKYSSSFLAKIGNGLIASLFYRLRFFCDPCLFSVLTLITFGNRRVNELGSAKNTSFFLHLNVLLELKVIIYFLISVYSVSVKCALYLADWQNKILRITAAMFLFAIQPKTKFILRTFRVEESSQNKMQSCIT